MKFSIVCQNFENFAAKVSRLRDSHMDLWLLLLCHPRFEMLEGQVSLFFFFNVQAQLEIETWKTCVYPLINGDEGFCQFGRETCFFQTRKLHTSHHMTNDKPKYLLLSRVSGNHIQSIKCKEISMTGNQGAAYIGWDISPK